MNLPKNIIGVDLGGTHIRAGRVIDTKVEYIKQLSTPSLSSKSEVINVIISAISQCKNTGTTAIGIGVPSVVDTKKGVVYNVINIPSWDEVPLKHILETEFNLPVYINNDSNCFAVGEKIYGKAKHAKDCAAITLGTGIGMGLICNGKLYEGRNCGAGEIGMIPYLDDIYESYCSGQFFSKKNKVGSKIYELALNGNTSALELYKQFGMHLGNAIKIILYTYDPEMIILGGSVSKSYDFFKNSMLETISDFPYTNSLKNLQINVSELENSAILGAAALISMYK